MIRQPKIGLLPLYVRLYDQVLPDLCDQLRPFARTVADAFRNTGVVVLEGPVCRAEQDIATAVEQFEKAEVDLLVTLHLAYSPSLEAATVLSQSKLPILMLDTTPDAAFGPDTDPVLLLKNHGIHGLQDLACTLKRNGKGYTVIAGHLADPSTMDRAFAAAKGAHAASIFRGMRVLRMWDPLESTCRHASLSIL